MSDDYVYPYSVQSLPVLHEKSAGQKTDKMEEELNLKSQISDLPASASTDTAPASLEAVPPAETIVASDPTRFIQQKLVEGKVIEALREIFDPEIPVNIYELGLIYDIKVDPENKVFIKMTLTAPACPVAGTLPGEVEKRVEAIPEVKGADVELVWEPPWSRELMSEAAMLQLGMF